MYYSFEIALISDFDFWYILYNLNSKAKISINFLREK